MNTIKHEFLVEIVTFGGVLYRKVIAVNKKEAIESCKKLMKIAGIKSYKIDSIYIKTVGYL